MSKPAKNMQTAGPSSPFIDHPIFSGRQISGKSCNIVLCLDGTENQFGPLPFTNVLKMYRLLEKDCDEQICYYQPGVGVSFHAESNNIKQSNFFASKISKLTSKIDAMIAFTLATHIKAAYKFLMRYYRAGDKIFLFGFSRGAFMARILAGMIERVGLLNYGLEEMVVTAWELYSNWEFAGQPAQPDFNSSLVDEFKETFSRENVSIHFMGLWDSVNSVGLLRDRMFPFSARSSIIKHTRHALSLDERRGKYKQVSFSPNSYIPSLFSLGCQYCETNISGEDNECSDNEIGVADTLLRSNSSRVSRNQISSRLQLFKTKNTKTKKASKSSNSSSDVSPDVVEMWFPGNHGDVGGGWPPDKKGHYLSIIPLRWMISQAVEFGVMFKAGSIHKLSNQHPSVDSLLSCHHDLLSISRTHRMNHHDPDRTFIDRLRDNLTSKRKYNDCEDMDRDFRTRLQRRSRHRERYMAEINECLYLSTEELIQGKFQRFDSRGDDSYFKTLAWWIVELFPIGLKIEDKNGLWRSFYVPNLGRSRHLPKDVEIHWSVYYRMYYVADYTPENLPNHIRREWTKLFANGFNSIRNSSVASSVSSSIDFGLDYNWTSIPDDLEHVLARYPNL